MDKATLVKADLEAGKAVIEAIEQKGIEIDVAAWLQDSETGVWQLVISSPRGGEIGVRPIYEAITAALPRLGFPDLDTDNVLVSSPHERLTRDLKKLVRTGDDLQVIPLYDIHIYLGAREFKSARIYRVKGETDPDGWIEKDARVRDKRTGRVGTVRSAIDEPGNRRYFVLYDLAPENLRPLSADQPPREAGRYAAESELDFIYAVRPGGQHEKPRLVARPA